MALGFDEIGDHGMIVGNLEGKDLNLQFVKLDNEEFIKKEVDVTDVFSKEDLIEKINGINVKDNQYVELILIGNRNFEINKYDILKFISNERIIKIKDNTKIAYDLEKIAKENTLKGIFTKKMLDKLKDENITDEEKEIIEKSIEIAYDALE